MSNYPVPIGDFEISDGVAMFALATKNFVLNSLIAENPCIVATTAPLVSTYANGTAGVGATLTSTANAVFTLDGISPALNARVLVKDQASSFQNGIYTLTTLGSVSVPWVLTRDTSYDSPPQILAGNAFYVVSGTVNAVTAWLQTATVVTVGTSAITFARLSKLNSVTGTANQIAVTGTASDPIVGIVSNPVLPGTAAVTLPGGSTAQRPGTLVAGMIRYNKGT